MYPLIPLVGTLWDPCMVLFGISLKHCGSVFGILGFVLRESQKVSKECRHSFKIVSKQCRRSIERVCTHLLGSKKGTKKALTKFQKQIEKYVPPTPNAPKVSKQHHKVSNTYQARVFHKLLEWNVLLTFCTSHLPPSLALQPPSSPFKPCLHRHPGLARIVL